MREAVQSVAALRPGKTLGRLSSLRLRTLLFTLLREPDEVEMAVAKLTDDGVRRVDQGMDSRQFFSAEASTPRAALTLLTPYKAVLDL